ncbi:uncharacterized protein KQ657_000308 [Scheffersomyces spartinae]|uniref:Phospholipid/glycerol acyltransferase domain-containing protein n=1 Tax=Scheffersomyces spartinae TaxID=45513 RepID=A0A9P8AKX7_9ASCO|nr:uncharacterized protein KQ657_000308 [Scheffersomyces spartinae]KAG7196293.1 hypothetical protein KQ657_000308 [Scheffersomyces spartinae]
MTKEEQDPDTKVLKDAAKPFVYKPFPWWRLWIYDFFLWGFSIVFDCFFREIRPRGAYKLPKSGAVIFVAAPHANQFVDPLLLMHQVKKELGRRVSFLVAYKSYIQKVIGLLSKCEMSIPVVRIQDNLTKGSGKIYCDFEVDPLIVRGVGTKFTTELSPKGMVALPQSLGASEVVEVISDTELKIRKEFKRSPQIVEMLNNGCAYKRAHKVDQKDVYNLVFEHLAHGNCIGIFPEGGSHDRSDLLPIKAGVAIMALGAMNHDPNCNVKIIPCGMNYFNAHKFRSRCVIEFGNPIEIPRELVKKYAKPETNREAVKDLLDTVTSALKAVTVTCEDYDTLMMVQAARRLYAGHFALSLPLPLIIEMNRRLVIGYQKYKDDPRVQGLRTRILKYNNQLRHLYLPDHSVEDCDETNKFRVLPVFLFRVVKLVFFTLLALPGAILFSPVFIATKVISQKKAKQALAASTVKIKANDVIATWKVLVSMGFAPLLYSFYATIITIYCNIHDIFSTYSLIWVWILVYSLGVLVTYSALLTGEQGVDLFKSLRPLYLSLTNGSSIRELKKMRRELETEITDLVNDLGPQLFPDDFNLLELGDKLKISDELGYVDSDAEEEAKTSELRQRRLNRRKEQKKRKKQQSATGDEEAEESSMSHSASVSDGISLMNSDNSLTNIPMFSDYQLHMNARSKKYVDLPPSALPSALPSSLSLSNDYHVSSNSHSPKLSRSDSASQLEFNPLSQLSNKIKSKIRENREL